MLRERLCSFMLEKHLDCYSPDYTTQKLKRRIANQCGTKIKVWTPNFKSQLVYSANLPTGQAVESTFVAAATEERRTKEAAYYILRYITYGRMTIQTYREAEECPWPPPTSFLLSEKAKPPGIFINFMKILQAGKSQNEKKESLLLSLGISATLFQMVIGIWPGILPLVQLSDTLQKVKN